VTRRLAARQRARSVLPLLIPIPLLVIGGCAVSSASPTPVVTPSASPSPTLPEATNTLSPGVASPSPTPEPPLSIPLPTERDERVVALTISTQLAPDAGGQLVVTVANRSERRIDEIVLRWPSELGAVLFLAPFVPTDQRIADGGPPLIQPWTKWVEGPGERGEPAGTTSLGYGPMDPGMTLVVPLHATRIGPGPAAFDLQVLAGEALLTLADGSPAELRVEVP
jgi:hypothetical protein